MQDRPHIWADWAEILQRFGLTNFVSVLLESTGPIHLLGAQIVYLGQPLLNQIVSDDHTNALADLLENPQQTQAFTTFLRETQNSE